ncbi:uncharacterized protein A4U43_C07F1540 [Asparagus officinalis]|uniref:Uncharacterized protein n=1 Tax=Asparagus officinalis TaxID=4686 RepID=A0A5P1E8Z9_ASPOF|nr:uncharacterized protein A4U43_C07F1540 [Asparagus officinalis]
MVTMFGMSEIGSWALMDPAVQSSDVVMRMLARNSMSEKLAEDIDKLTSRSRGGAVFRSVWGHERRRMGSWRWLCAARSGVTSAGEDISNTKPARRRELGFWRGKWGRRDNTSEREMEEAVFRSVWGHERRRMDYALLGLGSRAPEKVSPSVLCAARSGVTSIGVREGVTSTGEGLAVGAVHYSVGDLRGGGDRVLERGFVVGDLREIDVGRME